MLAWEHLRGSAHYEREKSFIYHRFDEQVKNRAILLPESEWPPLEERPLVALHKKSKSHDIS